MSLVEPKKRVLNKASDSLTLNNIAIYEDRFEIILDFNFEMMKPFLDIGMEKIQTMEEQVIESTSFSVDSIMGENQDDDIIDIKGFVDILGTHTRFAVSVTKEKFNEILTLGVQNFYGENHEMKLHHGYWTAQAFDLKFKIFNL